MFGGRGTLISVIKANAKVSVEKIFLVVFWFCSSRPANNLLCGVMDASKYENPSDEKFLNFQEKKNFSCMSFKRNHFLLH